jgi:N-acetylmuramoyl-L-alanine amidase
MIRRIIILSILIGLILFSSLISAQDKSFRIQYLYIDGVKYISINDLVRIYGGKLDWNYLERKTLWEVREHQITLVIFSPYVLMDSKVYNLVYEVKFKKGTLYVPLKNFYPLLKKIKSDETQLEQESKSSILEEEIEVTELRVSRKLNGVLIEILVSQPLEYEVFLPGNNWLNINFYRAKIDTEYFSGVKILGLIKEAKAYQFENSAQLSLLLNKSYDIFSHSLISEPYRIQISIEDTASEFASDHLEEIIQRTDLVDVVIIDPGHGGDDRGNIGPKGLSEKEVVLDIAKRIEGLFQGNDELKVLLTRQSDQNLPLKQRARFANQNGGDLFISLQTNFSPDPTKSGFKILFPGVAQSKEDSIIQITENFAFPIDSIGEVEALSTYANTSHNDTTQIKFINGSKNLATIVYQELKRILPTQDRGIGQADFQILRKAYMPGILVQIAYISNPYEELLLREDSFRQWTAQAIYQAIIRFKEKSPDSL